MSPWRKCIFSIQRPLQITLSIRPRLSLLCHFSAYLIPFLVFDLNGVAHVLLSGEDELVVDDPAGQVLEQGGVGMDHDLLVMFHGLIVSSLSQSNNEAFFM